MKDHPLYRKVTAFCSRAERSPQEVLQWMERHGVAPSEGVEILEDLKKERFIDEERFIRAYTADKLRFSHRGPLRIKQELRALNLPENQIDRLVEEVMEENDYLKILETLLLGKINAVDSQVPEELQRKVIQWAYAKGFELDDIFTVLRKIS